MPELRGRPWESGSSVLSLVISGACGRLKDMKRKPRRKQDGIDPKVLDAYSRWVAKHLDELVKNHAGKYIAVYRNKLVAMGDSYKEVYEAAEKHGIEEPPLTMQVPGLEDIEAILCSQLWAQRS